MIIQVPVPTDSSNVFNMIINFLPGINPAFVALISGWVCTRAIWLVKTAMSLGPMFKDVPAVKNILNAINTIWTGGGTSRGLGWIINPILMIVMGYFVSGKDIGMGTLLGFAGIGVREWLVKSPIPTSIAEIKALKGALALAFFMGMVCLPSTGYAADKSMDGFNPVNPNATGMELAVEIAAYELNTPIQNVLITKKTEGVATGWLSMARVTFAVNGGIGWRNDDPVHSDAEYYPWVGGKLSYLLNGRFAVQYDYSKWLSKDNWDNRVGLNFILF
jgi:hypothetical protein